jgi:hypothetical protein
MLSKANPNLLGQSTEEGWKEKEEEKERKDEYKLREKRREELKL